MGNTELLQERLKSLSSNYTLQDAFKTAINDKTDQLEQLINDINESKEMLDKLQMDHVQVGCILVCKDSVYVVKDQLIDDKTEEISYMCIGNDGEYIKITKQQIDSYIVRLTEEFYNKLKARGSIYGAACKLPVEISNWRYLAIDNVVPQNFDATKLTDNNYVVVESTDPDMNKPYIMKVEGL